jgi:tricorn protease
LISDTTAMRSFFFTLLLLGFVGPITAQEPIRFARTPDISPDGKSIAFSYLGDLFTVETIGGTARAVTSHSAHDLNPVFSPDGQHIAFSSNRHGSYDVFVIPARGGKPTRLTFDSAMDMVCGWSPDGKNILFASTMSAGFPSSYDLYQVPVIGGRVTQITKAEAKEGTFSPGGGYLAYVRGPGSWYRKGYRGSSNDEIWLAKADGSNSSRLTTFDGQDHSPMFSADGSLLYYVSERFGAANIVRIPLAEKSVLTPVQVTSHDGDEHVRRARISRNGEWIVYECGFDLWVVSTKEGSKPRKVAIEVNADDKNNNERMVTFTQGATEFALAPEEKHLAFAVQGRLFRMSVGTSGRATQMTFGSSTDHGMSWAPDANKILFLSDRNGHEDIYALEADDPDHPKLLDAHKFKVTQLTDTPETESGLSFAPDGKKVAFLRKGQLWTMNPDGKEAKEVIKDVQVFDYEWSPDSKWFVFARRDGSFASELYIVPATGPTVSNPIRNITRYATYNAGVTWSADGKKLTFLSERRGAANLHVLDLEKESAGPSKSTSSTLSGVWGSKPPLSIDWEDIHLRAKAVVRGLVDQAAISPDGSKVAYRESASSDLWVAGTNGSSITRLSTGGIGPRQITWSKRRGLGSSPLDVLFILDGTGQIRLCNAGGLSTSSTSADKTAVIPFRVKMSVKQDELYQEMFEQSWRLLNEHFYDEKFHGSNWNEVRKRYRAIVKHCGMKEDLYALMYLMMGELNASHLGVSGFISRPEEETAELGLFFEDSYKGRGLKVREILKRGPADKKGLNLKPGEVILSIDGVALDEKTNLSKLLNGKVGEVIVLQVSENPDDAKIKPRRVEVTAANRGRIAELMYDRWVATNMAKVSELSGGKLGYIHIPSMDEDGLDRFVRSLYSDNYDKDAIVLDVRFNGGGFTHDQVLNYLGTREHTVFRNRDGGTGFVLRSGDRKWHKPTILLVNNRSYSDAEIFPNAFRTLGLGKLVGEPTGGAVIGTTSMRLVDGSMFRIPRIGVWTMSNVNMDRKGVEPDVVLENHPDEIVKGRDAQLEKAIELLKVDVIAWKKKREAAAGAATAIMSEKPGSAATPAIAPMGSPK